MSFKLETPSEAKKIRQAKIIKTYYPILALCASICLSSSSLTSLIPLWLPEEE